LTFENIINVTAALEAVDTTTCTSAVAVEDPVVKPQTDATSLFPAT
jgi:hypothetical protein